jgi:bifunctional non-homologous end joining protein LigD
LFSPITANQSITPQNPMNNIATAEPKQVTLYYREGSSDKVYHVSLEADGSPDRFLVRFAYGRRGSALQTGTKTPVPVDYATALKAFNQLVASKLAKGYSPGQDGVPYRHTDNEGRAAGICPQLLTPVEDEHALGHLLLDPLYCLQEKHDGIRLLIRKRNHVVEGINRRGLIVSVPEPVAREALRLPGDCLLDGEAIGDVLHVFDLLEITGADARRQPYADRLNWLRGLIPAEFRAIHTVYTAWTAREKLALLERLRRESREGVVLKNLTAAHTPGRPAGAAANDQLKYKFVESASFLVLQAHPTRRSVCLGLHDAQGRIVDVGNVTIPANQLIPKAGAVVEVRYLYAFRQSGAVYQPCYLGEREDIEPAECTLNQLKYRCEPAATLRV